MIKNLSKMIFMLGVMLVVISPAFAQYEVKNSFYFMQDDGIFSDEEKDEEAEYIRQQCEKSALEKEYYDCSCIAGAFRIKRDDEKLNPQGHILRKLYNDPESKCVDSTKIAGNMYTSCQNYAKFFRERMAENKEYCECVAKTVTKEFIRQPRLKSRFINNTKVNAMTNCGVKFNNPL